jgi:Cys-tRNA(Pro)/Cys-tRNA(Cys) deacylase
MTPAINLARKHGVHFVVREYAHDPDCASYGLEAAEKLGVPAEQVYKTLVVKLDGRELAVGIIPVTEMLNLKLLAQALGAKKAEMADKREVERSTGYIPGGVSPIAQKKPLRTCIDTSASTFPTVFVSAGKRGLDMELAPTDLKKLTAGEFAPLCR